MGLNISKTGIVSAGMVEPFITLSDGSNWQLLLFHLVDKGTRLFTSTNCDYCNDFGLYSRLKWIDNFTYNNKYEFYVIQDGTVHRWTQTNAPWSTTAVSGFEKLEGTVRSGLCKNSSNTALAITSGSTWWNAVGSYTSYSTGGKTGIPGFGPNNANGVCEKYLALYVRIDKSKAFFEDGVIQGVELYEY